MSVCAQWTKSEFVGWGWGTEAPRLSPKPSGPQRAEGQEHCGRNSPALLEKQKTRVQSFLRRKRPRRRCVQWGIQRSHTPQGACLGWEPETRGLGVSRDRLSRRTPSTHSSSAVSQKLRPEGVRRSAPAGTEADSALPFRRSYNCSAAGTRTSLSTRDHAGAGPHRRGRELDASRPQVPGIARPRPRGWRCLCRSHPGNAPHAAETWTLMASTHLPAPAAAKVLPALLRATPRSQIRAPGHGPAPPSR